MCYAHLSDKIWDIELILYAELYEFVDNENNLRYVKTFIKAGGIL